MPASYQWEAAFVAYCNAVPEEEISTAFNIPIPSLKLHMSQHGWAKLRVKMPPSEALVPSSAESMLPAIPDAREAKLAALLSNREKNLKVFEELRNDLIEVVTAVRDGTFKLERYWHFKGMIVTKNDVNLTMSDRLNLAAYAKTIAEGTYRALGDFAAAEKVGQDVPAGQASAPAITIILPGAISCPRNEREIVGVKQMKGQVIDLTEAAAFTADVAKEQSAAPPA